MDKIVVSGINLYSGGTLSIYKDFIKSLLNNKVNKKAKITLFIYKKELFKEYMGYSNLEFIELPLARKNYLFRMWYEYIYFKRYSKDKNIDLWISIHDMTPNVKAKKQYVYCHNPMIFYKCSIKDIMLSPKMYFFSKFYKYIYKINIKNNTGIVVQSQWMREEFLNLFDVNNVIVARPYIDINLSNECLIKNDKFIFLYPAYPRIFKNFEIIFKAAQLLNSKNIDYEIVLTIDGNENKYTRMLKKLYGNIENIKWIGIQNRDRVISLYEKADCLIFPSKLETWGLPISEFSLSGKPMLLADLSYSRETIGKYSKCSFFNPDNEKQLAELMQKIIYNTIIYDGNIEKEKISPYAENWDELLKLLQL